MTSFEFDTPTVGVPPMQQGVPTPDHPGGPRGSDTVPAWLTPGEFVVNKEATDMFGPQIEQMNNQGRAMQAMNGSQVPEYAEAGKKIPGPYDWITDNVLDGLAITESGGRHTDSKGNLIENLGSGAIGKYQWKPSSAKQPGYEVQPFDVTNEAAQRNASYQYLKGIQKYNPDFTQAQVLQSFNAGPGRMRNYVDNIGRPDAITNAGLTAETFEYPGKVFAAAGQPNWDGARAISVVSKGNPSNQIDQLTYNVPELDGTIPPPVASVEVPGFERQDPSKMSPGRLAAYNKALAIMNNNGMPIETSVTKNRRNIDTNVVPTSGYNKNLPGSDYNYDIPELDGVVPIPKESVVPIPKESSVNQNALNQGVNITTDDSAFEASNYKDDAKTYLHPGTNVLYTINENKQLVDISGTLAPMNIQYEWNNKQAGESNKAEGTERTDMVVNEFRTKSIAELESEALALKEKANKEVEEKGVVNKDTITAIAKNNGITAQVTKKAENQEIKRHGYAVDNFNKIEDDYNTAKNNALSVGVTSFPTMTEWMKKQGLDNKDVNTTLSITNTLDRVNTDELFQNKGLPNIKELNKKAQNEVVKNEKALTLLQTIAAKTAAAAKAETSTHSETNTTTAVENSGETGKGNLKKAESMFESLFGDLFDMKELARMAVMYTGSRLLGSSHNGALGFSAVNYLKRIDSKAAGRKKTADTLLAKGKHTSASIADYSKSGDMNDLILIGVPINATGNDKYYYHPTIKKKRLAREYKQGDSTYWSFDGGKSRIHNTWTSDGSNVRNSDEYQAKVMKSTKDITEVLKEFQVREDAGKVETSSTGTITKRNYHTDIKIAAAARAAAKWGADRNLPASEMGPIVARAYQLAINESKGSEDIRASKIEPYLNALIIRDKTKVPNLFTIGTGKDETMMDISKITKLSHQFLRNANADPTLDTKANRDKVSIFWESAGKIWSNQLSTNPGLLKYWTDMGAADETPFYKFAENELSKINK